MKDAIQDMVMELRQRETEWLEAWLAGFLEEEPGARAMLNEGRLSVRTEWVVTDTLRTTILLDSREVARRDLKFVAPSISGERNIVDYV